MANPEKPAVSTIRATSPIDTPSLQLRQCFTARIGNIRLYCMPVLSDEFSGDDLALHLGGTFTEPLHAQIAKPAFEWKFVGKPKGAVYLDTTVDHLVRSLGAEHFGDRRVDPYVSTK